MGVRHAFDADHMAAVASLSTRTSTTFAAALRGVAWGAGHTGALFGLCALLLLNEVRFSPAQTTILEGAAGLMLVLLGLSVLLRLGRDRPIPNPDRGVEAGLPAFTPLAVSELAPGGWRSNSNSLVRPLVVGMVHGLAGSAGLVVVAASAGDSPWHGLAYVASFGVGSITAMVALSTAIAIPLALTAQRFSRAHAALECLVGFGSLAIGAQLLVSVA